MDQPLLVCLSITLRPLRVTPKNDPDAADLAMDAPCDDDGPDDADDADDVEPTLPPDDNANRDAPESESKTENP